MQLRRWKQNLKKPQQFWHSLLMMLPKKKRSFMMKPDSTRSEHLKLSSFEKLNNMLMNQRVSSIMLTSIQMLNLFLHQILTKKNRILIILLNSFLKFNYLKLWKSSNHMRTFQMIIHLLLLIYIRMVSILDIWVNCIT